jgi:hypothetical protein
MQAGLVSGPGVRRSGATGSDGAAGPAGEK